MSDKTDLGHIITELTFSIREKEMDLWEKELRLHIKPKPTWLPGKIWWKLVNLVLIQSAQEKRI